jgi:hypothetical protein
MPFMRRRPEPDRAAEPSPLPPCAATRRCSQGRQRKYALLLALGSVFEPKGLGLRSGFAGLPSHRCGEAALCSRIPPGVPSGKREFRL